MAEVKLTPNQLRRIEVVQGFLRDVAHLKRLLAELEAQRAARPVVLQRISSQLSREFSQMRQRAISANIGTIADVAGALSTMAGRSQGMMMKLRGLNEGLASLSLQLDQALKDAMTPEKRPTGASEPPDQ
jgi:hypothetical protein